MLTPLSPCLKNFSRILSACQVPVGFPGQVKIRAIGGRVPRWQVVQAAAGFRVGDHRGKAVKAFRLFAKAERRASALPAFVERRTGGILGGRSA